MIFISYSSQSPVLGRNLAKESWKPWKPRSEDFSSIWHIFAKTKLRNNLYKLIYNLVYFFFFTKIANIVISPIFWSWYLFPYLLCLNWCILYFLRTSSSCSHFYIFVFSLVVLVWQNSKLFKILSFSNFLTFAHAYNVSNFFFQWWNMARQFNASRKYPFNEFDFS